MSLDDEVKRLERSRNATFVMLGVIAAQTPEMAARTHDATKAICSCIIDAYRVLNDAQKTRQEKIASLTEVTRLEPHLDWLMEWTTLETEDCRFDLRGPLEEAADLIGSQISMLKEDFQGLISNPDSFGDVFDVMLALLEQLTEFYKLGHAMEVCRVISSGKNAYAEADNMLNIEVKGLLVDQAKLLKDRCYDLWNSTEKLVKVQEGTNKALRSRVDHADMLLRSSMPNFIIKTRDVLLNPDHPELREFQKHAYLDLVAVLDELNKILERVKVKYTNEFDEDAVKLNADVHALDKAAMDVLDNLVKLHAPEADVPEADRMQAAEAMPELCRSALSELSRAGASPTERGEFISAVKRARDGDIADFFPACETISELCDKVKLSEPSVVIPQLQDPITIEEDKMDLLDAAKAMCSALAKLNITLDD